MRGRGVRRSGPLTVSGPPPFRPSDSVETPVRLNRLETWATRHEEWARQHSDKAIDEARDLERRLASLESWKMEAYSAIGQIKVRLTFVMLIVAGVSGIVSSVVTALLVRILS